ncbi:MAG: ThiF family adenylyltransferase [Deltaproteobacteria bacterium]|nr:ThiF family adenylyltransferase [Deltaproteobacteria bacterium]
MHPWFASLEEIDIDGLILPVAKDFARYVSLHGSGAASLDGVRRLESGDEVLLLRVATGRPQRPVYPILREELIGIIFAPDGQYPYVMSAREDFPDTPHQNIVIPGVPYSLCIDDRSWREAKITYTPAELLQRIVIWFERAGKGELHETNQPLDPYFLGSPRTLILPGPIFEHKSSERCDLVVVRADEKTGIIQLEETRSIDLTKRNEIVPRLIFITCEIQPDRMSRMRAAPTNLAMLHQEMETRGTNLLELLADNIDLWISEDDAWKRFRFESNLGILLKMPVIHPRTGQTGAHSLIAFVTGCSLGDVGVSLGRLNKNDAGIGELPYVPTLNPIPADSAKVKHIQLDPLNVTPSFDPILATRMAGREECDRRKVTMVGAGAIGSLVADSLAREGYFSWTIIDNDVLLPHNMARHALIGSFVGFPKAECLAIHIQHTVNGCKAEGIVADVIEPNQQAQRVNEALNGADIVLDASASIPVSRYLCDMPAKARRAAFFFNPAGTSAVLMVEDAERLVDLRTIEATFYSRILEDPALADILVITPERLSYSGDCRALTTRMPCSRAHVMSGLIAFGLSKVLNEPQACLRVWRLEGNGYVKVASCRPEPPLEFTSCGWTIRILPSVADRIQGIRRKKLPSETGGAILGVVDIPAKRIEVMVAFPPPPDSEERPDRFLRGTDGLKVLVTKSMERTLDHIRYVGEWHSHPKGYSTLPSRIDLGQLAILSETLSVDGCPGVQVISGDHVLSVIMGILPDKSK